jgi:DNA-directed RNA polymerase specialized sigma24 family protein
MDISEGAVKTHLSRSRKHLNALLRIDPEPKEEDTRER